MVTIDFFELIKNRHSVRAFKNKEVEEEKIRKILEAANLAPSAGNLQSYEIILIRNEKTKKELVEASYGQKFIEEAPVVVIICANPERSAIKYGRRGAELYCINDADIAASYIQLAATELGLGSCWVGAFDEFKVKNIIKAPEYVKPIAIIPIGYPDEIPYSSIRRNLDDLVHEERY